MTTSLDVSRKLDQVSIDLLLAVDSTAAALSITYCIIGAFARDVILGLCFGIDTGEALPMRLYGEHAALLDEADFDLDAAGARILGRDLAAIAGRDIRVRLEQILERGVDRGRGEPLLRSLPLRYEVARRLLQAFAKGLRESSASRALRP